jgi:hypothetical protein
MIFYFTQVKILLGNITVCENKIAELYYHRLHLSAGKNA